MLKVGDIVKHDTDRKRIGIVVEVNNNTVTVEWFRDNQQYRYFQQNLIKVSL